MRKIPLKNYIILGIIIVVSVFAVLYFNQLYKNTKNSDTILYDFIKEVKPYELDNYIIENPNFIMYISSRISSNKTFEKKFKNFLMKYDLQKDIPSSGVKGRYVRSVRIVGRNTLPVL